jgi:tRNA nucleotidyltransferase (CCA-adding enzyme)
MFPLDIRLTDETRCQSSGQETSMRIVTTHKNTDFDALASVVAATLLYPDAIPALPKPINSNVKEFLSLHKDLLNISSWKEINYHKATGLIVVDASSWERLSAPEEIQNRIDLDIILFDHHIQDGDIPTRWSCREAVGANITLMLRKLKEKNVKLTPVQSTLFLTGLYEDTGNLSFSGTTAEDAHTAGYLLEHQADLNLSNYLLRPAYGQKQKNILFEMLKTAKRDKKNGFHVGFSKVVIKGFVENLAVVVHMFREILNVDVAFGLFAHKNHDTCIVIGRSNNKQINVGAIMRSMGGGGHPGAGSALIKAKSMDAIEENILMLLNDKPKSSILVSDLMSFPVMSIRDDATMGEAANLLREKGCTGVPVVDQTGKLVGVLSRRDFQRKVRKDSQLRAPVKAYMSTNVISIQPGESPNDASGLMIKHDIGRLPVVDNGHIIGILTRSDVMRYWYDPMPE